VPTPATKLVFNADADIADRRPRPTRLSPPLVNQGRRDEARNLLAPVYGWFTEGSETLDLKEAKALLDELAI
jgi:predicted ATPase